MKSLLKLFAILTLSCILPTQTIQATCVGKIDIGPAFAHIDILESGHTVKRMDMWAVRGDFAYLIWKGLFIKPTVLYGNGGAAKGGIFTGTCALGFQFPVCEGLTVSPQAGVAYSHLWTKIDLPQFQLFDLNEKFKSWTPYIALEACYTIQKGLRISGSFQYGWSRSHTTISKLVKDKSNCMGPAYALMIEQDLSDKWSINFAGAYNLSLTKEKHGIRATGVKMGLAYWF